MGLTTRDKAQAARHGWLERGRDMTIFSKGEKDMAKKPAWSGVFPAATTQFRADFSLDVEATRKMVTGLVAEGISGLIAIGTVGENNSLSRAEKLSVMEAIKDAAGAASP